MIKDGRNIFPKTTISNNMRRVLFIGGAGFIGSNLITKLCKKHEIHVCEPAGAYVKRLDGLDVNVHQCSLKDIQAIGKIINDYHIDVVVHLVSTLIPGSSYEDYKNEYKNMIFPSIELMEICAEKGVKFIYFSSGGTIYGNRNDVLPFVEEDPMAPISYYGWSKQMMENSILFMHRTKRLDYLIVRPSNPYGHGQNLYGKQGLVAVAIGKILKGEPVEVWGDGSAVRDYIYIDDLGEVFRQLIEKDVKNTTLNIGSGRGYSVNDVLAFLKIASQKDFKIVYQNPRPVDVSNMVLDLSNLNQYVDAEFTPFMDGIKTFYEESVKENR